MKNLLKVSIGVSIMALLAGCGGGSGDNISRIDLAEYMPAESVTKTYDNYEKWGVGDESHRVSVEEVTVSELDGKRIITITSDGREISKNVIGDDKISSKIGLIDTETYRYINLGDMYYNYTMDLEGINTTFQCTLEEHLTNFSMHGHSYSGDIYKSKCLISANDINVGGELYDYSYITYLYSKKDVGLIAEIGNHCQHEGLALADDKHLSDCPVERKSYIYKLLVE